MVRVYSSPQRAPASTVRSTSQAATATTGRVRSIRTTRTSRATCTSRATWIGAALAVATDIVCGQFALNG